jgi:hypothetical protein
MEVSPEDLVARALQVAREVGATVTDYQGEPHNHRL